MRRPSGSCSSVAMPCRGQEEIGLSHVEVKGMAGLPLHCSSQLSEVPPFLRQNLLFSHLLCTCYKHDGHFESILLLSISVNPVNSTYSCHLLSA